MIFRSFLAPVVLASTTLFTGPVMASEGCPGGKVADVTEQQVIAIKTVAGGDEGYKQLMLWAKENLPASSVAAFDEMVECGNVGRIMNAVVQVQAVQQMQASRTRPMTELEVVQLVDF